MPVPPSRFLSIEEVPRQVTIHLNLEERRFLRTLMREFPDFPRLLTAIFDKGLTQMTSQSTGLTPEEKVEAKEKSEKPAVAPSFVTGKRRTVASSKNHPEEVENYVGFSIDLGTQEHLQEFLDAQPEASLEEACLKLLQLGLHHSEMDLGEMRRSVVVPTVEKLSNSSARAEAMVTLAERLCLRAKTVCGF